jgi:adenosylhomocysteine nucleosidase
MLYRGELWDLPFAVVRCGPGKVAAAAAAQAAVQYLDPWLLVSFGAVGCHDPRTAVGTLAAVEEVVDVALTTLGSLPVHIPDRFQPDPDFLDQLLAVPGCRRARLACWEGHVAAPGHRPPVEERAGSLLVVDWESAAVARVAELWGIAWGGLRVVSDHGGPERLRQLAHVARRPLQWAAEVLRRATDAYARAAVTTQSDLEGGETAG